MLKAVLFDLDGVIVDTAADHFKAWQTLAKELDIHIDASFNEKLKGLGRFASLEKILEYGSREKDFTEDEKISLTDRKNEMYQDFITRLSPSDIHSGIIDLLEDLENESIPAVITSGSRNASKVLDYIELKDAFDDIVNLEEIERGKPYPDIFLKGAQLAGAEPWECVAIEDGPSGITAIQKAHICAIGVGDSELLTKADAVYSDTRFLTLDSIRRVHARWKTDYKN